MTLPSSDQQHSSSQGAPSLRRAPSIELHFSSGDDATLEELRFFHPLVGKELRTIRGNVGGAFKGVGTFRWSSAVRGFSILLLKHLIHSRLGAESYLLRGGAGSLAASLDYAITKQPAWILDTFGLTSDGTSIIRRILSRTNTERKLGGDVLIGVNSNLDANHIAVFKGSSAVEEISQLEAICANLQGEETATFTSDGRVPPKVVATRNDYSGNAMMDFMEYHTRAECARLGPLNGDYTTFVPPPEYFSLWKKRGTPHDQLREVRARYGAEIGDALLMLHNHATIHIENISGDAEIVRDYVVGNAGNKAHSSVLDRLWLEYPRQSVEFSACSLPSETPLNWTTTVNSPFCKWTDIELGSQLEPCSITHYRVRYRVPEMFRFAHFFYLRVFAGTLQQSFTVNLRGKTPPTHAFTCAENPDADSTRLMPVLKISREPEVTQLHWHVVDPEPRSVIKTAWTFS